jgi:hypothetical protein
LYYKSIFNYNLVIENFLIKSYFKSWECLKSIYKSFNIVIQTLLANNKGICVLLFTSTFLQSKWSLKGNFILNVHYEICSSKVILLRTYQISISPNHMLYDNNCLVRLRLLSTLELLRYCYVYTLLWLCISMINQVNANYKVQLKSVTLMSSPSTIILL